MVSPPDRNLSSSRFPTFTSQSIGGLHNNTVQLGLNIPGDLGNLENHTTRATNTYQVDSSDDEFTCNGEGALLVIATYLILASKSKLPLIRMTNLILYLTSHLKPFKMHLEPFRPRINSPSVLFTFRCAFGPEDFSNVVAPDINAMLLITQKKRKSKPHLKPKLSKAERAAATTAKKSTKPAERAAAGAQSLSDVAFATVRVHHSGCPPTKNVFFPPLILNFDLFS